MSSQAIEGFWVNIVAGVVLLGLDALLRFVHGRLTNSKPTSRVWRITTVGAFWVLINTVYAYLFAGNVALVVFISSVAIAWVVRSELNQFWRIGLVGADKQIQAGINFRKALGMVSSSMDFLGIGAAKLTGERAEFEAAVSRCQRPDSPVRFLLCRPDDRRLIELAQSADKEHASYQTRVLDSLRAIADLRNRRAWNIQVRFYQEFPTFRLMFIDDTICLASHYVLGKGSGSELPQLHVVRPTGSRDVDSLFYGFTSYFERFWGDAEDWDFKRYLEE
ncbi:MAG TPA: hypothetical protein VMU80_20490 [Bryobacteraceae bacterium]|nr:hypothetical protein [Bryobacteraceae bacterium]